MLDIIYWCKSKIRFAPKLVVLLFNLTSFLFSKENIKIRIKSRSVYLKTDLIEKSIRHVDLNRTFNNYLRGAKNRLNNLGDSAYLLHNITFSNNPIIIDCGANIGELYFYLRYMRNISSPTYIAFEPSPQEYICLSSNINNNFSFEKALSSKVSKSFFSVIPETADGHLVSSREKDATYNDRLIDVEVTTIDNEIKQLGLFGKRVELLKLEAEGSELDVLKGSVETLPFIDYIAADLGFEKNDGSSSLPEVTNFLTSMGFELLDFGAQRFSILFSNKNVPKT